MKNHRNNQTQLESAFGGAVGLRAGQIFSSNLHNNYVKNYESGGGGAIYFTCHLLGKPKSARDISTVAGVSEGTIKLVYRLYYMAKEKLVKQEWIDSGKADLARLPIENSSK